MTIELRNQGSYNFLDISTEEWRCYIWDVNGEEYWINNPQWLAISETGHRVLDAKGISHYIPFGWHLLKWKAREGAPHFVK